MIPKSKTILNTEWLIVICIALLTLLLPSITSEKLINSTQTGKFFFFSYSVIILVSIFSINQLFHKHGSFRITIIDISFAIFILWISVNKFLLHDIYSFSFRYFELLLLGVFYFILRNISVKYFSLLLLTTCIGGIVQAIYGNLQLWGLSPSHHQLFQITGSFFNPGPYSGYLCSVLPIAVGLLWILKPEQNANTKTSQYSSIQSLFQLSSIAAIISIAIILPATQSRAAWLGAIAGVVFIVWHQYNLNSIVRVFFIGENTTAQRWRFKVRRKQILFVSIIVVLLSITCFGLYHFKKGSADGRILIWKVSTNIIKDYPIIGVGQDRFKAYYCDYQAGYFRNNIGSPYESLAVDNQYAFNEFLNVWAENGMVGFLLLGLLLFSVFKSNTNLKNNTTVLQNDITINGSKRSQLPQLSVFQSMTIFKASIISILVFGCFAYPSEILPIKMVAVACLAMLSTTINNHKKSNDNFLKNVPIPILKIISISIVVIALVGLAFIRISKLKNACIIWNNAYNLYTSEHYDDCLKEYDMAWPELNNNGDYLLNYGKALSMAKRNNKAIDILERAKLHTINSVCYTSLGDSYLAFDLNQKAEEAYQNAHYITPAKFYPEYLLAKYYSKTGDKVKAKLMAQKVLQKQIKVKSKAIDEIFQEMHMILNDSYNFRSNVLTKDAGENNQATHAKHLIPFRLEPDTCFDRCTEHNNLIKKEVR